MEVSAMPSKAIGTSLNYGFPGEFARNGDFVAKSRFVFLTDTVGPNFGDIAVLNSDTQGGTWSSVQAAIARSVTVTAAMLAGVFLRNVKQYTDYNNQNGIMGYLPGQPADVCERGSGSVVCNVGTPAAGGQVYVRIALNGAFPAGTIGGIEAAADGSNTLLWTNVSFHTGLKDVNNVTEITIKTRAIA
jgi:hypothetical protein